MSAVERWPAFREGVAAAGARAGFALPLRIGVLSVGALDLYRDVPGELTAGQLSAAMSAGVPIDEAFLLLRAHAFATDQPVAEVAKEVVERRLRLPAEDR